MNRILEVAVDGGPYALAAGSDGAMWVTLVHRGAIARVEGKTRRIKLSETVGDWSLKEVRPRDVVFARGTETRVVSLRPANQANQARQAAPRPAFSAPVWPGSPAAAAPAPAPAAAAAQPPPTQTPPAGGAPSNPFVIGGSRR